MTQPNTRTENSPNIKAEFKLFALLQLEKDGIIKDVYGIRRPTATSQVIGFTKNGARYNAFISYDTVIGFIRYGRLNDVIYLTPYHCITKTTINHRRRFLNEDAQTTKRNLKSGLYKMSMLPLDRIIEEMEAEAVKLSIESTSLTA